jgi:hypothetical protein
VGSLSPTFVPARRVSLAVKLPCAFTLNGWFPFSLREPLGASVTLSQATAPVKLPTCHRPPPGSRRGVRVRSESGWYSKIGSAPPGGHASLPPSYPTQTQLSRYGKLQSSSTGSFCPAAGLAHLYATFNFTGSFVETVPHSLHLSCGSELTRQGISLP